MITRERTIEQIMADTLQKLKRMKTPITVRRIILRRLEAALRAK